MSWKFYYFRSVGEAGKVRGRGKKDRGILSRGNNRANRRWCNRFWWILNLIERRHFLPIKGFPFPVSPRYHFARLLGHAAFDFQLAGKFFPRPCLCSDFPRWSLRIARRLSVPRACSGGIIQVDQKKRKKNREKDKRVEQRSWESFERVRCWKTFRQMFSFFFFNFILIIETPQKSSCHKLLLEIQDRELEIGIRPIGQS